MPVCHWTQHAYGSWLPDRPQGFFLHGRGLQPANGIMADGYRRRQPCPRARFDEVTQRVILEEALSAGAAQGVDTYAIATDNEHFHAILAWRDARTKEQVCIRLKESLTRRLKKGFAPRPWFTKGADRRRVRNRKHLDYLLDDYLPSHRGWKWDRRWGMYLQRADDVRA